MKQDILEYVNCSSSCAQDLLDTYEDSHKRINNLIRTNKCVIEMEEQYIPNHERIKPHVDKLLVCLPDFRKINNLNIEELYFPEVRGQKFSKMVLDYNEKYGMTSLKKVVKELVNTICQEMDKCTIKDINVVGEVSTDLMDFMKLGHNDCDNGSCFNIHGSNSYQKVNLAASQDTFVIYLKKGQRVFGRAFGFLSPDYANAEVVNICNYYGYINKITAKEAFGLILQEVFGQEYKLHENLIDFGEETCVYHNSKRSDWTYADPTIKKIPIQVPDLTEISGEDVDF